MKCSNYSANYHITCVHLVKDDPVNGNIWYCPPCIQCILPFNHVDDDDVFIEAVIEDSLDCSYRIREINNKIFVPFEINDDSPYHEIDPDMQFYSDNHYIQSTSCDYYLEDSLNEGCLLIFQRPSTLLITRSCLEKCKNMISRAWLHVGLRIIYMIENNMLLKTPTNLIKCGVPQGSILGPLLFLIYNNDLSSVSEACFSILFADDTNMFITGHNLNEMFNQLNADLLRVQEWLHCNKLSLNVLKTHYMIFTPRNKIYDDISIIIDNTKISRVYVTKFLGVQIDSQLSWKMHMDYICKKLSECTAILLKARKVLGKACLTTLYYTFAYPYFIYCNHVWGNTYQTNLDRLMIIKKKLIRIITGSPYRAHTEPLFYANRILNVYDLNVNVVGVFMYKCIFEPGTDVFANYFYTNRDIHGRETRNADALYVPYGRLDIRRSSIKIHSSDLWNTLPPYIQNSDSSNVFKIRLRNYLIDRKMSMWYENLINWGLFRYSNSWWLYLSKCY